jgi:hypothetical protein
MTALAEKINKELPGNYKLVSEASHKSSNYYYIDNKGKEIVVRTSDHDAIATRSKAHIQILIDMEMHLDIDFESVFDDEGYETEMTLKEASSQASEILGCEISEDIISECDEDCLRIDVMKLSPKKWDEILSKYIAYKITDINTDLRY